MSQTTLKIGFVGAGAIHFGRPEVPWDHASRLEKIGGLVVIGIVDPDTCRSDQVLKERLASQDHGHMYAHCRLITDYKELLEMRPDVVFIGSPPGYRGSPMEGKNLELEFTRAGIHAFVEKPLSVLPPEEFSSYACSVTEACRTNNLVISVGYKFRYHAGVLKMKELIAHHGGRVMAFNARYYWAYTEGINKYWFNSAITGGPIVEQATHFCDLARYIVGEIDMTSLPCSFEHHRSAGMSKTTLRIGFIGAGAIHFGRPEVPWDHASRLEKIGGLEVVGIVDPDTCRSDEVLKERLASHAHGHMYAHCRLLTDYRELLGMRPDVVFIGIPPAYRGSPREGRNLELEFARAGIHLFVEKPLSIVSPEEFSPYACLVTDTCRANEIVLSVGYMFRYHAAVLKMKELIAHHGGKVMAFNARYYFAYTEGINRSWFHTDFFGGPIVEQATHFCDLARYIVGEIDMTSLHTLMLNDSDKGGVGKLSHLLDHAEDDIPSSKRIPRVTLSHWRFQDGGLGALMHSVTLPGSRYQATIDVQLDGLQLSLIDPYESTSILRLRSLEDGNPNQDQDFVFENDDTYLRELDTFIKAVRQGKQSLIKSSYEDAMKTYELTWAIRRQGEVKM